MLDFVERRDYTTRPMDIWRCKCGYHEPRLDPERAVNYVPTCPYCCPKCTVGFCTQGYHDHLPMHKAVRKEI